MTWYYVLGESKLGPVEQDELEEAIGDGLVESDTLVWHAILGDWTPAAAAPQLRHLFPDQVPDAAAADIDVVTALVPEIPRLTRPWPRYWARVLDYSIGASAAFLILIVALAATAPGVVDALLEGSALVLMIVASLAWIPLEALFLASLGATPGKWLFNIRVDLPSGDKLAFDQALKRSFDVWVRGVGLGIPIVALITQIVAYRKLTGEGQTSWDRAGGYDVHHGEVGPARIFGIMVAFAVAIALYAAGS